ncbi:MAG: hypothetical protein U5K32_07110 [Bacteroidales bacterium]|nr:hypothetical protein [Bacteroidales bacterium]
MKKILAFIQILLLILTVSSCRNTGNKGSEFTFPESDSIPIKESEKLSHEAIDDIVQNIGSPVEIASLLIDLEVPFISEHLASIDQAENLSTNFQKALRLGIYGADLGYLNIYDKTGDAVETLTTINRLADGLRVGQFFNFETLKKLAVNKSNIDSLLFMSVHSYNQIDEYLRENDRGYLSALMITGVWLEGQYLACQVVKDYPHMDLKNRIAEQKIIINDLLMLLRPYNESSDEYSDLYDSIEQLKREYSDVDITYTPGEPETVEKDGRLVVVQHEESNVRFSDKVLERIIMKTEEIRNKIVSL